MIDAKELRIGNWVINDCDGTKIQVEAGDILTQSRDSDWLCPIPLTPEILEKAGFKLSRESSSSYYWMLEDFYIQVYADGTFKKGVKLKYVHQLQNLYFCLTGKELEITPPA